MPSKTPPGAEEARLVLEVAYFRPEPMPKEVVMTLRQLSRESKKEAQRLRRERRAERFEASQREVLARALEAVTARAQDGAEGNKEFTNAINMLLPDLLPTFNPHQNRIQFRSRQLTLMEVRYSRFTAAPLPASAVTNPTKVAESFALTPGTFSDVGEAIWALATLYVKGLTNRFRRCTECDSILYAHDLRRRVCPPPKDCAQKRKARQRRTPEFRKKRSDYMRLYRGQ